MATLKSRLKKELEDWFSRLPRAWQPHLKGTELDFDGVDACAMLKPNEKIWPLATGGPKGAHLFKALRDLNPNQVRAVIFGNDPYTKREQATGRSFEQGDLTDWKTDMRLRRRISDSLKSILCAAAATNPALKDYSLIDQRYVYDDYNEEICNFCHKKQESQPLWFCHVELARGFIDGKIAFPSPSRIFRYWARQGVLWLNRTLTFTRWGLINEPGHRRSHQRLWAPFTRRILETLVRQARERPLVFVMWGGEADDLEQEMENIRKVEAVSRRGIRCVKAGHPMRPEKYFRNGNPLSQINKAIAGSAPAIKWYQGAAPRLLHGTEA